MRKENHDSLHQVLTGKLTQNSTRVESSQSVSWGVKASYKGWFSGSVVPRKKLVFILREIKVSRDLQSQQAHTEGATPMGGSYLTVGPSWLPSISWRYNFFQQSVCSLSLVSVHFCVTIASENSFIMHRIPFASLRIIHLSTIIVQNF